MSALSALQDDWIGEDEGDLLDALDEIFAEIAGVAPGVGETVTGAQARSRLDALQEQGWLEFATDEGTSVGLYAEAVKRLHRRTVPVAAPVLEAFSALRVLDAAEDPAAARLRADVQAGRSALVLDIASLFAPRAAGEAGGSVPFASEIPALVVVRGEDGLALHVVAPDAAAHTAPPVDPTLPAFVLGGTGERVAALSEDAWAAAVAEMLVVQSHALVGQSQALLDSTVDYLTVREQFGVPIGSFQALRHRAADVAAELYAAQQLSIHIGAEFEGSADRRLLGLLGRSLCGRSAVRTSSEAVQLRGGMGFTWEDGTHFGLKRIMGILLAGPAVEDAEKELGASIIAEGRIRWAGGAIDAEETN